MSEITYYLLGGAVAVLVLVGISLIRKGDRAQEVLNAVATVLRLYWSLFITVSSKAVCTV